MGEENLGGEEEGEMRRACDGMGWHGRGRERGRSRRRGKGGRDGRTCDGRGREKELIGEGRRRLIEMDGRRKEMGRRGNRS